MAPIASSRNTPANRCVPLWWKGRASALPFFLVLCGVRTINVPRSLQAQRAPRRGSACSVSGLAPTLVMLAVAAASTAQDPQPPVAQLSPPVLRITVLMIQVDAVVTDSAGKHIAGLRPEDFEILQDGVAQKLTHFLTSPEPRRFPSPKPRPIPNPNRPPPKSPSARPLLLSPGRCGARRPGGGRSRIGLR
jgi:hypothetical protein